MEIMLNNDGADMNLHKSLPDYE